MSDKDIMLRIVCGIIAMVVIIFTIFILDGCSPTNSNTSNSGTLDPTPKTFTENIITEEIITENIITWDNVEINSFN